MTEDFDNANAGELAGRTILVTGGTRGLGFAMATALRGAGATVVITGRDRSRGEAAARQLGNRTAFLPQNAIEESEWERVVDAVLAAHGPLAGVINNAGGSGGMAPIAEVSPEMFKGICDFNVRTTLLGMQFGYRAMRSNPDGGAIVNIASIAALYVHPLACGYCASKAVLPALSRGAAAEFAACGVRVNTIFPGTFSSELAERDFDRKGNREAFLASVPMRRLGEPSELGGLAVYLTSDRSRGITGADFVLDGGKTVL